MNSTVHGFAKRSAAGERERGRVRRSAAKRRLGEWSDWGERPAYANL